VLKHIFLLSLIVLLMGCGFQLKGAANLSPQLKQLNVSQSTDQVFNAELMRQLKSAGARISEQENIAFLSVSFHQSPAITIAQSSSSGLTIQQLKISIDYSLKNASGKWLAQQKTLTQSREFESNSDQILAKNKERLQLYTQMKQNLVRLLLYQMQSLNDE